MLAEAGEATVMGGLGSVKLKQATGKGWVRICSPMGTDEGAGAGTEEGGGGSAGGGGTGTTAPGRGAGRRILNLWNMKATELWKLVLGVSSVVPAVSMAAFFKSGPLDAASPTFGPSVEAVGSLCTAGLGTLREVASAADFFTLKSSATSSLTELVSGGTSWAGRVPLSPPPSLSQLSLGAGVVSGSVVASGVCTSRYSR